jgi:hypothetical protein
LCAHEIAPGLAIRWAAADNAGHRRRVVRVTVGRSADQFVGEIEACEGVHGRYFERVMDLKIRQQPRDAFGEHGFARARRTVKEHVVPARRSDLAGPLGLDLANDIRQIETAARVTTGALTHDLNRLDQWQRDALQEGNQLSDRGKPEDFDPVDQLRFSGLTQRHDHTREASLLSGESGWQNAAHRTNPTVQPPLT